MKSDCKFVTKFKLVGHWSIRREKPEAQERMMIQSKQACDSLSGEQHLESFGNMDPERSLTDVSSSSRNRGENYQ